MPITTSTIEIDDSKMTIIKMVFLDLEKIPKMPAIMKAVDVDIELIILRP